MDLSVKKFMNNILYRNDLQIRGQFLKRIGILLGSGYSVKEAIQFLKSIESEMALIWLESIEGQLMKGMQLYEILEMNHFPKSICIQIYFSSQRGEMSEALLSSGDQMIKSFESTKKVKRMLHYPLMLVFFLIGMLLLMRFFLLPHVIQLVTSSGGDIEGTVNYLIYFVYHAPSILFSLLIFISISALLTKKKLSRQSVLEQMNFLMKIPIFKYFYQEYWTYFYFWQWGMLIDGGSSVHEIVQMMKVADGNIMLKGMGDILGNEMEKGKNFNQALEIFPFLSKEAIKVINHGEQSGKLGVQMNVYSVRSLEKFEDRMERMIEKIQPCIFIGVAIIIVMIYGALMLPVFSMMEGLY